MWRDVKVRECLRDDLRAVQSILAESPQAASWSSDGLAEMLDLYARQFVVASKDGEVCGFAVGRIAGEEAEILNLAVRGSSRRNGVGKALVIDLLKNFEQLGVTTVFLEVRESNHGAIGFYERLGFSKVGVRAGYYRDPEEAGLVLRRDTRRHGSRPPG